MDGLRHRLAMTCAVFFIVAMISALHSRESYEDYRDQRDRYNRRDYRFEELDASQKKDRPLSEVRTGEREDLLDELRGAVRDEIDESISKERKASKKSIDRDRLIGDVKKIVREEIEDAIKIKQKRYLSFGTIEVGGFIAFQTMGLESKEEDINYIFQLFPLFNYFVHSNIAMSLKAEMHFNLTTNTQAFNINTGPSFVFGLNRDESICFFASMYAGISMDTTRNSDVGWRFSNEIGLKFILTSGVILNVGLMIVFDNGFESVSGFSNLFVPALGITAWF
jgi:hypothetical protein